jgi:hypothetical protein
MLAGHASDLDRWTLSGLTAFLLHIHHHAVEEVEIIDIHEVFSLAFALEMRFCMRSGDDRQISAERLLDFLVKVIP